MFTHPVRALGSVGEESMSLASRALLPMGRVGRNVGPCRIMKEGVPDSSFYRDNEWIESGSTAMKTIPSPALALAGGYLPMMPRKMTVDEEMATWLLRSQLVLEDKVVDGFLVEHCLGNGFTGPEGGLVAEFGVFQGNSLRLIASRLPGQKVYGFDSFIGFQDDWDVPGGTVGKEFFDINGDVHAHQLGDNVQLVKGYFNETLPGFLEKHTEPFSFVHIDCDMYTSTKDIFNLAGSRIQSGTVIVFDEFFCHGADFKGEFTAFYEWVKATGHEFEYIGAGDGSHDLMTRFPKIGEPLFVDRLGAALMFNGLKTLRGKSNFATAVAVKIL